MTESELEPLKKLQQLREAYSKELPTRVEELIKRWHEYSDTDKTIAGLDSVLRSFHGLAGSAASYGYPEVTELCRDIELILLSRQELQVIPSGGDEKKIETKLNALRHAAGQPSMDVLADLELVRQPARIDEPHDKLIFIVEDDDNVSEELSTQLQLYGYKTKVFRTAEEFTVELNKQQPDLLVMDIFLPDADGTSLLKRLHQSVEGLSPAIIMSTRVDTRARLRAVRAGAAAFFEKPLNISKLIDKIDLILNPSEEESFRVLVIDDDKASGDFVAATLENSGFVACAERDPFKVMNAIVEFSPELILLDLYMPECDGFELAEVIRQQENYLGMPIVFLSAETNRDKQLTAMKIGGDEFLTKPISPAHLISAVSSRKRRYRQLSSLMVRDSLTGLYNHTSIKEILDKEVSRSLRHKMPVSYAMVDIDFFKKVNDTYGHSTGDRVIKLLARLLTQRLRKSDYIGRYGGEEFAVIMPETDAKMAAQVMNKLREDFSKLVIHADEREFNSTFSCGVADVPTFTTSSLLAEEADQALYRAKQEGRNQIICAENIDHAAKTN